MAALRGNRRLNFANPGGRVNQPLVKLSDFARLGKAALLPQPQASGLPQPKGRTVKPVRGSMNGLESRYSKHLDWQIREGHIATYWFEAFKVRLADLTWYTPDFLVMLPDGLLEWRETKGWMREDANLKTKITSDLYWQFPVKVVTEKRGAFTVREVGR